MERTETKNLSDLIYEKLNLLQGNDIDGKDKRFKWQLYAWLVGKIAQTSRYPTVSAAGTQIRIGAENSFADYMGEKITNSIRNYLKNNF